MSLNLNSSPSPSSLSGSPSLSPSLPSLTSSSPPPSLYAAPNPSSIFDFDVAPLLPNPPPGPPRREVEQHHARREMGCEGVGLWAVESGAHLERHACDDGREGELRVRGLVVYAAAAGGEIRRLLFWRCFIKGPMSEARGEHGIGECEGELGEHGQGEHSERKHDIVDPYLRGEMGNKSFSNYVDTARKCVVTCVSSEVGPAFDRPKSNTFATHLSSSRMLLDFTSRWARRWIREKERGPHQNQRWRRDWEQRREREEVRRKSTMEGKEVGRESLREREREWMGMERS